MGNGRLHDRLGTQPPLSQRRYYDSEGRPRWLDEGEANGTATARRPGSRARIGGQRVSPDQSGDVWTLHGPRLGNGPKGKHAQPTEEDAA